MRLCQNLTEGAPRTYPVLSDVIVTAQLSLEKKTLCLVPHRAPKSGHGLHRTERVPPMLHPSHWTVCPGDAEDRGGWS